MRPGPKELTPRRVALLLVLLAALGGLTVWRLGSAPKGGVLEFSGETMGSTYSVKVARPPRDLAPETIQDAIQARLDRVEALMSTYRPGSELSRFNASQSDAPFPLSEETFAVFAMAQRVSAESGGAFDVTVGPLVNAWGFGPNRPADPPSDAQIDELRARVNYHLIELDATSRTIRKPRPDIYCDLSAIAQGFGSDEVAEALDALGVENYMVDVSGDVRARGTNGQHKPWSIGIERPIDGIERSVQRIVPLADMAMTTSGDYRNYREIDGKRVSHEIDPHTGRPIAHDLASATVFHPVCAMADAYDTALIVLGEEAGMALADKLGLPVFMIVRTPNGFEERTNAAFDTVFPH